MSPSKIFNNFFKKMYSKNMSMRTIIFFTIVIVTGSTMSGKENCCEQCCEYLGNCCKKEGEEKEQEEFYLKKSEATDLEKIKKLVSSDWYKAKKETALFILYEKINGAVNQNLNENGVIKVKKDKNGFSIEGNFIPENDNNAQKWALFEIIYKEEKEKVEGEKDKEKEKVGKTVYLYCSDVESIGELGIFESCKQYISISVIDCNTSKVTSMFSMFYDCSSLQQLDFKNFNTETVTRMSYIFHGCSSLTRLNLSNFNTEKVTEMSYMFFGCSSLTELDLSNFNTGNVNFMGWMFNDCSSLQTVTFNKDLPQGIKQQLNNLGLTEEVEEENKITLKKKQHT